MSNAAGLLFGAKHLQRSDIAGKRVLDVGSHLRDMSLRPLLEFWQPASYTGIDKERGPGVDVVCGAADLAKTFGPHAFDVVICMEVLEHIRDWRSAVSSMKNVLAPEGILLLTTRSYGFPYHGFPDDFWRYEESDLAEIFSDLKLEAMEKDSNPGIFAKFRKPSAFKENDLSKIQLHSIVLGRRVLLVDDRALKSPRFLALKCQDAAKKLLWAVGKRVYRFFPPPSRGRVG